MRHPDVILYNATVRTMDPARPVASLVAVHGGRVSFVGDAAERGRLQGPATRLIDCQGGCLIPGFHDAHLHLPALASRLVAVDCSPEAVSTLTQLKEAVSRRAAETPRGSTPLSVRRRSRASTRVSRLLVSTTGFVGFAPTSSTLPPIR